MQICFVANRNRFSHMRKPSGGLYFARRFNRLDGHRASRRKVAGHERHPVSVTMTLANVRGSVGATPNSNPDTVRVKARALMMPKNTPAGRNQPFSDDDSEDLASGRADLDADANLAPPLSHRITP